VSVDARQNLRKASRIMVEQPLSSDRETALARSAPAQRAPSDAERARRRPWSGNTLVRLAVLIAAGLIVVLFATQWDRWIGLAVRQVTDNAYVRGDITPLNAHVEGYVRRVPVDDFQRVKQGEVLVEIEDDDYRARVAQAEADLLGARAAIENLKARKAAQHAQVAEAEDAIKATQADVERTRLEASRQRTLLATTFGTRQRVEQADAEAERFTATLSRNQAELEAQRSQMAVLDTQEAQLRAEVKAKQAALDLAKINLGILVSSPR
jgi:membrane fusion protein, multidrug efflux system